jgi:hypothetical protein
MASNRSSARTRGAAAPAPVETPRDALATVARRTARIQLAALAAAGKFVAGWTHAADRFAQAIGDELLRRVDGETDSRELIARVATATDTHLQELTALPSTAVTHFDMRLARVPIDNN